jgi:MarR family transcriptional regulator, negative regulator of the multidrug operon emrRAB
MPPGDPLLSERLLAMSATFARLRKRGLDVPIRDALLVRTVSQLGRAVHQMGEEAIRPTGLGEAEFRVLLQLYSQPEGQGHPGELCSGVAASPANITRITDQLVARGLIGRATSEQDRRRTVLQVTPGGEALVRSIVPQAYRPLGRLLESFSASEREQLQGLLDRLVQAWDEANATTPSPAPAGAEAGAS